MKERSSIFITNHDGYETEGISLAQLVLCSEIKPHSNSPCKCIVRTIGSADSNHARENSNSEQCNDNNNHDV